MDASGYEKQMAYGSIIGGWSPEQYCRVLCGAAFNASPISFRSVALGDAPEVWQVRPEYVFWASTLRSEVATIVARTGVVFMM